MVRDLSGQHLLVACQSLVVRLGLGKAVAKIVERSDDTRMIVTHNALLQINSFTETVNRPRKVLALVLNGPNVTERFSHLGHYGISICELFGLKVASVNVESIFKRRLSRKHFTCFKIKAGNVTLDLCNGPVVPAKKLPRDLQGFTQVAKSFVKLLQGSSGTSQLGQSCLQQQKEDEA